MSLGGDDHILDRVMPILGTFGARCQGNPCVAKIGPGHYVKIVHNGFEQGMLSVLNESWEILFKCLHTDLDEISRIFEMWGTEGELVGPLCYFKSHLILHLLIHVRKTLSSLESAPISVSVKKTMALVMSSTTSKTRLCKTPITPKAPVFSLSWRLPAGTYLLLQ